MQTEKIEFTQATFENKYCPSCDYGYDDPEDSCLCDESCGAIGCQGSKYHQKELNRPKYPSGLD